MRPTPHSALTNSALTGLGTDTLTGISAAMLTGDGGNNALDAGAFSGPVKLDGGPGIDTLEGGSAADALTGATGNDTIDGGGNASDRVVEAADTNIALSDGGITSPGIGSDSLLNVELATLTGGGGPTCGRVLDASGFTGAATINGAGGTDTLSGGSGGDTLNGGEDGDAMDGGGGLDTLNGEPGDDTLKGGEDNVNDALHGDEGQDRVVAAGDKNFTLTNTNLIGNGNDELFDVQLATLTGGPGGQCAERLGVHAGWRQPRRRRGGGYASRRLAGGHPDRRPWRG